MILNKIVIGVVFNEKIFRLATLAGQLSDAVIKEAVEKQGDGIPLFNRIGGISDLANYQLGFSTEDDHNTLHIDTTQVVYTRASTSPGISSLNLDKVIAELDSIWKTLEKILKFPGARRVGIVGEFIALPEGENSSDQLISALSKFPTSTPACSSRFLLNFEEKRILSNPAEFNMQTSDYWNCIYSFYNSERDEVFKLPGRANFNIDVQRYYNPAKLHPLREVRLVQNEFKEKRKKMKEHLTALGLINE